MGVNVAIILILLPALALLPKARAGCGNSARPDPCGGPPARAVPTATGSRVQGRSSGSRLSHHVVQRGVGRIGTSQRPKKSAGGRARKGNAVYCPRKSASRRPRLVLTTYGRVP